MSELAQTIQGTDPFTADEETIDGWGLAFNEDKRIVRVRRARPGNRGHRELYFQFAPPALRRVDKFGAFMFGPQSQIRPETAEKIMTICRDRWERPEVTSHGTG